MHDDSASKLSCRGAKDKVAAVTQLALEQSVELSEICFVGDSDRDAPAMAMVGLGLAPADATPAARASAHRVLTRDGGRGAVAEAARIVLDLRAAAEGDDEARREITRIVTDSIEAHRRMLDTAVPVLARIAFEIRTAFATGRKVLLFGNGGSAADAQHIAGELVGRFAQESEPWPAIALTTDTSVLTCTGNDWEFAEVFRRQVRALARSGDVVAGISTSGKSENVLRGLAAARERGAVTVGFTGSRQGPIADLTDICFCAPSDETPRIQELHILAWHAVCELVEKHLVARGSVHSR